MKFLDILTENETHEKLKLRLKKIYHVLKKGHGVITHEIRPWDPDEHKIVTYEFDYELPDEYKLDIGGNNQMWVYPEFLKIVDGFYPTLSGSAYFDVVTRKFEKFNIFLMPPEKLITNRTSIKEPKVKKVNQR